MNWTMEAIPGDPRFPFRLSIRRGDESLLCLRVQERWPGNKGHIFCLREEGREWPPPGPVVEDVEVVAFQRLGRRLVVVLDRPLRKRCDFLFLTKQYKTREGEYEQIFWRTQQGLRANRTRVKLSARGDAELQVAMDSAERYAWRFPGCRIDRWRLPAGDYALVTPEGIVAVIERKTLENLLAEMANLPVLHQRLAELLTFPHAALVVEARYSDLFRPDRVAPYQPAFTARAVAEIQAFHPRLPIVFAGNRKLAQEWALRFFQAVRAKTLDAPGLAAGPPAPPPALPGATPEAVRRAVLDMPPEFTTAHLRARCPAAPDSVIRHALQGLQDDGLVARTGRGRATRWVRSGNATGAVGATSSPEPL